MNNCYDQEHHLGLHLHMGSRRGPWLDLMMLMTGMIMIMIGDDYNNTGGGESELFLQEKLRRA